MTITLASYICIDGETNSAIDKFGLNELCGLLSITADQLGEELIDSSYEGIHFRVRDNCSKLETSKKALLAAALCDLIRYKLREQETND